MESLKSKTLGLLIHNDARIFTNGITQNAYFMYKCFEGMGYRCQFLCLEANPIPFAIEGLTVQQLTTDEAIFHPPEFHTIISVTRIVTRELYDMLRKNGVRVVSFICGNSFMKDQEDFVRAGGGGSFIHRGDPTDELWLIPSFARFSDYFQLIRGASSSIVPHLWSPSIFNRTLSDSSRLLYALKQRTKCSFINMEPNTMIVKTAWLPIVACDLFHQRHPDLLEEVRVHNFPGHAHARLMVNNLTLGGRFKVLPRDALVNVFLRCNQDVTMPIFVCHQMNNTLNYLYYEVLYYGFPLVHNSPDLEGCGYFYKGHDVKQCADAMLKAYREHDQSIDTYRATAKEYLRRVDPESPEVRRVFEERLRASVAKVSTTKGSSE